MLIIIYLCTTLVKYICKITTDIIYMHTYTTYNFFLNSSLFMMALSNVFVIHIKAIHPFWYLGFYKLTKVYFLLSDLIDTDIANCHIGSSAYRGHRDSLRAANTTAYIHSVLANKLSLAFNVTGKVTDRDTVLVFCLMYSQSQY